MNEEKEELKKQVEKLQAQVTLSNAQVRGAGPRKGLLACPHGEGDMHWRVLVRLDIRRLAGSAAQFLCTSARPFPSVTSSSGFSQSVWMPLKSKFRNWS